MQATITLSYSDEKTAQAITNAVSPDNHKTPPNLTIKTYRNGNTVITEITAKEKLATFIATIDDLLFSASTAEKTLQAVKQK